VAVHHYLAVLSVLHGAVACGAAADDEPRHDAYWEDARVHDVRGARGDGEGIADRHLASVLMKSGRVVEQKAVVDPACFACILGIPHPVHRENLPMYN